MFNKALSTFIVEHLNYAKLMLITNRACDSIDAGAFVRYSKVLSEVEKHIEAIMGSKKEIKIWVEVRNFTKAKEVNYIVEFTIFAIRFFFFFFFGVDIINFF